MSEDTIIFRCHPSRILQVAVMGRSDVDRFRTVRSIRVNHKLARGLPAIGLSEDFMRCECGCGATTNSSFLPGHDQKLRIDLEHRTGGLLKLKELVEAAESYSSGELHLDLFSDSVRRIVFNAHTGRGGLPSD
jgi:hypothetical protein